jgi:hypothetical protein
MKLTSLSLLLLPILLCCCQQSATTSPSVGGNRPRSIIIDSTLRGTVKMAIRFISDRHFSSFQTPLEARFFSNGFLTDSIIQPDFKMCSWYSSHNDTIDLVAHIGQLETTALLIRFIGRQPTVWFFRAPHEVGGNNYFKINKEDSFSNKIEVPLVRYELKLSELPDTTNKQVVFGHITMESSGYYDKRDSVEQINKVQLKFYFRSQYRKFNFLEAKK